MDARSQPDDADTAAGGTTAALVDPGPGPGRDDPAGASPGADVTDGPDGVEGPAEPTLVTLEDPDHPARRTTEVIGWVVVALACVFVAVALHPEQILRDTTATGGDMGAHVWGPAYLRDHLLPEFRLTGWTPDWYAGFPAYVFYMVIPSLAIVLLNVGPPLWATPFLLAAVGAAAWYAGRRISSSVLRTFVWICLGVVALLCVPVPYNIAFKVVTVSGLVTLPLAAYALGRAARLPFPGPPLLAVGAAAFLFETGYTILGGNIPSTMAGEFAFSISLTLAVLYLAVLVKGIRTRRDVALGAVLFGLVILCHLIPAIFAFIATVVLLFTRREDRVPWWDSGRVGRWIGAGTVLVALLTLWLARDWFPIVGTVAVLALFVSFDVRVARFALVAGPVGFLVAAFWFVPFYLNSPFLNDMGWEKYTEYAKYLWPDPTVFDMPFRNVVFALAALGVVLSMVHRVRMGWWLTLLIVSVGWIFRFLPQYRLWNARILPFYYLALYLLAALAVVLVIRSLALVVGDLRRRSEEPVSVDIVGLVAAFAVVLVALAGSMRALPGGSMVVDAAAPGGSTYQWLGIKFPKQNISGGWALYNYQGIEGREAYPEYRQIMDTMESVGRERGCGRAMWEYEPKLDRFGTPMALMLLPYFTDGCIGSMEGLYFEASSTTPFHFLNQSELSVQPSRAQRDLPYGPFNMDLGISHLQLLGVKYYMASSQQAIDAARRDPRLTEVASFSPKVTSDAVQRQWAVFEVADSDLVVPLSNQPVVLDTEDDHIDGWVYGIERAAPVAGQTLAPKTAGPAVNWYLDPSRWDVPLATSGPAEWKRIDPADTSPPRTPVTPAKVSDVRTTTDSISFKVDRVGSPVVVRTSYFPNWKASGAEGPYRVSPNLMVVVPTEKEVTLAYGNTWIDYLAWFMTVSGFALVGLVAVREERSRRSGADGGSGEEAGADGDPEDAGAADADVDAEDAADGDVEDAADGDAEDAADGDVEDAADDDPEVDADVNGGGGRPPDGR